MTNLDIINAANALPLTAGGVKVVVSGAKEPFATVTIADKNHPFYGWNTTYAWPVIRRVIERDGTLTP